MSEARPVLVAGEWRPAADPEGTFAPYDPSTGEELAERYPVSGRTDVEAAVVAGVAAARELRAVAPALIGDFLDRYADGIDAVADELVATAHRETGLPTSPRLRDVELPRTTGQLRQAAAAARDGSWRRATIDTAAGIRSIHAPLGGPVVVFGPNNFPYAFNGVAGGDFAAAIAAGNPVIAKGHPGHPGTTELLARVAHEAVLAAGLPPATVQLVQHMPAEVGLALVADPRVGASAFTGSRRAGLALKAAADAAGRPIYLEMSSLNPVFVLGGALAERGEAIAGELYASCVMGTGQFCTKPGLTVVPAGAAGEAFVAATAELFAQEAAGVLFGPTSAQGIADALDVLTSHGAEIVVGGSAPSDRPGFRFANTVLRVSGAQFLAEPAALQTEAFGTVATIVLADGVDEMAAVASALEGNLTATLYSAADGGDDPSYEILARVLRPKVGRLLDDKMPTGVAVSPAMNHGGPFPATGHPGFTAVGIPASLLRFTALHSYDNVRPHRLPVELADANPTGSMWRLVDGEWSTADVHA